MVEINLTIVIQVVQFLILVFLLNRLLFRPIGQVISERKEKITTWEETTRALQESVRTRIETYEKSIQEAKDQARAEQNQINNELMGKEEERLREASEEAAQIVDSTRKAIRGRAEELRSELRQEAAEMSRILAEKVLGRKLS